MHFALAIASTNASGSGATRLLTSNLLFHSQQMINSPVVFTEFFSRLNTQRAWLGSGTQRGNHPRQALQSYDEATPGTMPRSSQTAVTYFVMSIVHPSHEGGGEEASERARFAMAMAMGSSSSMAKALAATSNWPFR